MDLELKKAFVDLQHKVVGTNQKLQLKDQHIEQMIRMKKENETTSKEFTKLSLDTVVYESVGRSFILTDLEHVKENLIKENRSIDEKIATLVKDKEFLTRSMKQSEENLRELIQQKKNQT